MGLSLVLLEWRRQPLVDSPPRTPLWRKLLPLIGIGLLVAAGSRTADASGSPSREKTDDDAELSPHQWEVLREAHAV